MHCPGCGVQASADQKYCRGCGLGLEKFSVLMAEQASTEQPVSSNESVDRREMIERLGKVGGAAFLTGSVMFALYLLYVMIVFKGLLFIPLAMIFFFGGGILLLAYIYYTESQKEKSKKMRGDPSIESMKVPTTKQLSSPNYSDFISSVTEKTTDLLAVQEKRSGEL